MRTALNLLNKIVDLGYDQQKTLICIDKILDEKLGIEGRKPLSDENLSDIIYDNILGIFQKEARSNQHDFKNNIKILCNRNTSKERKIYDRKTKY